MIRLGQRVTIRPSAPLSERRVELLRAIPAVWAEPSVVRCPLNARGVVRAQLRRWKVEHAVTRGGAGTPVPADMARAVEALGEAIEASREARPPGDPKLPENARERGAWGSRYAYQQEGMATVHHSDGRLMLWSPGKGKTSGALLEGLTHEGPLLIVCPASVRPTWVREVRQLTLLEPHAVDPEVYARKSAERLGGYLRRMEEKGTRPVVIVGWERLAAIGLRVAERLEPGVLIFDESHRGKAWTRDKWTLVGEDGEKLKATSRANTSAAARDLSRLVPRRRLLTGTFIPNTVSDGWAQCDLADPRGWGRTRSRFAIRYAGAEAAYEGRGLRDSLTVTHPDELRARLRWIAHVVPHAVGLDQLPAKTRQVTLLPAEQQVRASGEATAAVRAAAKAGPDYLTVARRMEAASRKRRYLLSRVEEYLRAKRKVVVLTGLRDDAEQLYRAITKLAPRSAFVGLGHGGHSVNARDRQRVAYMNCATGCLVGTEVYGIGVDLQHTDLALIAMVPWTSDELWQAEQRFNRPGQDRPVLVEIVACEGTIDEDALDRLIEKSRASGRVSENPGLVELADALEDVEGEAEQLAAMSRAIEDRDEEEEE